MHVQIVNFNLKDMTDDEYRKVCDDFAPVIGAAPGLLSKVWLADASTNTYGGVYLWRDSEAMAAFAQSETFKSIASNPHFANITSKDFGTIEAPTRVTRGLVAAAA